MAAAKRTAGAGALILIATFLYLLAVVADITTDRYAACAERGCIEVGETMIAG